MSFNITTMDVVRNSRHENSYSYYKSDSNEFLNLVITYDDFTPFSFIHTIRDHDNVVHGWWGYLHEMYPNATVSQKIKFCNIIKEAWAQWVADLENNSAYNLAIDNPFTAELAKMYITRVQNKEAL